MRNSILLVIALCTTAFLACEKENVIQHQPKQLQLPDEPYSYEVSFPDHFGFNGLVDRMNRDETQVPEITDHGATLGRVLFYDTKLSLNNSVACGSCHIQSKAFSDGKTLSPGFKGRMTTRNSMSIGNNILSENLFWDSRSPSILDLTLQPVKNHIEMGMENMDILTAKLTATDYYPDLFEKAFGDAQITEQRISNAMAQFLCSMTTNKAKYDEGMEEGFSNYTPMELMGKDLFLSNETQCASCHSGSNFAAQEFFGPYQRTLGTANIGLDLNYKDEGKGRGHFRIPSLRNIALTAPYMHDGRFETLEEVIDHYDSGIQAHPDLDDRFKDRRGNPVRLNLNAVEKTALIAFLHTLTDEEYIEDPRFSNPFK